MIGEVGLVSSYLLPLPGCECGLWVCNKSYIFGDDRESSLCKFSESLCGGS